MGDLGSNFYKKLLQMSNNLDMPPEILLNILAIESGFNPKALAGNKIGGAAGIAQITPKTLESIGYKGNSETFRNLPAEEQLVYLEKLIRKNMNTYNGGRPFKSITQYYVSHFLPAVLSRQDIRNENPDAILASKNPTISHIPHNNIAFEKKVYDQNSGLDSDKDGNITYGDLTRKLSNAAGGKSFREQVELLKKYTDYEIKLKDIKQPKKPIKEESMIEKFYKKIEEFIDNFLSNIKTAESKDKYLYKKFLPENNFVIEILSNNNINSIEFGRLLCLALDEELLSNSMIYSDNNKIEIQCNINGPYKLCEETIKQLSNSLLEAFKESTLKIGKVDIKTNVINKKSSLKKLNINSILSNRRKFLLKFA